MPADPVGVGPDPRGDVGAGFGGLLDELHAAAIVAPVAPASKVNARRRVSRGLFSIVSVCAYPPKSN
jgi:hypothetical protein